MSKTPDHLFTILKTKQSLHSFILDGNMVQGVRLFAEQAGGPTCEFPIPTLKINKHKANKQAKTSNHPGYSTVCTCNPSVVQSGEKGSLGFWPG